MIYVGSQYFRAPTPAEEDWDRDMRQAEQYGLDYVRFWLMWNWSCRRESEYDFSSLGRLLDACHKHQVKALMLVNLESVPGWLVKRHPEAVYVDATGGLYMPESVGNTPSGGFPGLCFHNEPVAEYARDYIAKLVGAFRGHPAVECWEPHNEPMFEPGRYNDHIYCYCPASIEAFRRYLEGKYGDVDALNANWRRNYGEFDEVQPPRRRGAYNDWLDWRLFNLESLLDSLRWRIGTIRENDPGHYVMIHTRGGAGITRNLAKEGIDDYRMAEMVDKFGTAAFPQCGPVDEYFLAMTGARCAARGKEFWMAELQSGPYGMGVHRSDAEPVCEFCGSSTMEATIDQKVGLFDPGEVTPERLKMWSWSGIAQGGKGVLYWQYRNESFGLEYGFGLTELDGSPSARLEAVKEFKDVLVKHASFFEEAAPPPAEIAIAWDPRNDIVNWTAVGCTDAVKNSIKGIHRALLHCHLTTDVVRLDEYVEQEDLSRYQIIYLPFSPFVSAQAAAKLRDYVAGGGTLVAVASLAQFDDTMRVTSVVPGQGLDEVFGCRRADVRTMPGPLMPDLLVGRHALTTRMHKEVLAPADGARVIGHFSTGEPAVVENEFGEGRAIYIGTNPFISYVTDHDLHLLDWMQELNEDVTRHAWTDSIFVAARVLARGARRLVFLMNLSGEAGPVVLSAPAGEGRPNVQELIDGGDVRCRVVDGDLTINEHLGPYGTKVYLID